VTTNTADVLKAMLSSYIISNISFKQGKIKQIASANCGCFIAFDNFRKKIKPDLSFKSLTVFIASHTQIAHEMP
jgi:hypothetical protein